MGIVFKDHIRPYKGLKYRNISCSGILLLLLIRQIKAQSEF